MKTVNLASKLSMLSDHWQPAIVGELNGQHVKIAKIVGEFIWHKHDLEDELFFVLKGELKMHFRDREVLVNEGEFIIVPKGVEHKPVAVQEVHIMLFEPAGTLNTGDQINEHTQRALKKL